MSLKIDAYSNPERTFQLLRIIGFFGHADARTLGLAAFRETREVSLLTTVRREMDRLIAAQLITADLNAIGASSYFLTGKGARFLNDGGCDFVAKAGPHANMTGPTFYHRQIATTYLATRMIRPEVQGCLSEFLIAGEATGFDPNSIKARPEESFSDKGINKLPDGLVFNDEYEVDDHPYLGSTDWIEAENARKTDAEYHRAFRAVWHLNLRGDQNAVIRFTRDFEQIQYNTQFWMRLVFAVPEHGLSTLDRIHHAVQSYDAILQHSDAEWGHHDFARWEFVRNQIQIAIIPFKRGTWYADGEVKLVKLADAREAMTWQLQKRARASMTIVEKRGVFSRELSVIREAVNQGKTTLQMPDFGFQRRQARRRSHRPFGDAAHPRSVRLSDWMNAHQLRIDLDGTHCARPK